LQVSVGTTSVLTNVISSSVNVGTQLNNPTLGKLFITTNANSTPQIANNTMVNHLEVNGLTRLNGTLNIVETVGTMSGANNGSIILDHENNGGVSSITFRSKINRERDLGYIRYQDAPYIGNSGKSSLSVVGIENDADDHIILLPSGIVGIGLSNPSKKLTVSGNITASGGRTSTSLNVNGGLSCQGAFCTHLSAGNNISCGGTIFIGGETWHRAQNRPVFYFDGQGRNYYRGGNPNDTSFPPHIWRNRDDNGVMSLLHSGELRASVFTVLSDIRIKKKIEDFDDTIGLEKILLIEPKTYK